MSYYYIGKRLRTLLDETTLGINEVADHAELTPRRLVQFLGGQPASEAELERLATAFPVEPRTLLDDSQLPSMVELQVAELCERNEHPELVPEMLAALHESIETKDSSDADYTEADLRVILHVLIQRKHETEPEDSEEQDR